MAARPQTVKDGAARFPIAMTTDNGPRVDLGMTDDLDIRRRRAAYRATHRGTKEMDALIGRYAVAKLPSLEGTALHRFEELLAMPDPTVQAWIFSLRETPSEDFAALVRDIRAFHGLSPGAGGLIL